MITVSAFVHYHTGVVGKVRFDGTLITLVLSSVECDTVIGLLHTKLAA